MAELAPDQSGFIKADGQRIYWERFGTGSRETICLLNGLAMHTKAWYGFVPVLTDEFDVLLWDYLGQGESSGNDVPYEIPRFCDYLTMIADDAGIGRFHLMGISYGGFVGRYKDRRHCLIRLTEAQDRLFAALDGRVPEYGAIPTPTLIMAGAEDRAIPPWAQRKLCGVLPNHRFELVAESGHCVYIEQPEVFFGSLARFAAAKSLDFDMATAAS